MLVRVLSGCALKSTTGYVVDGVVDEMRDDELWSGVPWLMTAEGLSAKVFPGGRRHLGTHSRSLPPALPVLTIPGPRIGCIAPSILYDDDEFRSHLSRTRSPGTH
jgi:hypothetical protein